jgi:methyl-CpG-binding domain protein 4
MSDAPFSIGAERRKQNIRREQRKQELGKTSSAARETLLQRLRSQLGPSDISTKKPEEEEQPPPPGRSLSTRPAKKSARNAGAAQLPTPVEQPPAKYRRINRETETLHDEEMLDAAALPENGEEDGTTTTTPKKNKRPFLELLTDTMERNREARRASLGDSEGNGGNINEEPPTSPLAEAIDGPAVKRRKKAAEIEKLSSPDGVRTEPRIATFVPPVSPYGLLEEELYDNPWKLLIGCLLLNKTSANQVRGVIWDLFALIPTPEAAAALEDTSEIEKIIQPLGLFRKRAVAIKKMSVDYLEKQWRDPKELFNLGQYAADAYFIFCRGMWRDVYPEDKDLKRYRDWLESTAGLGSGLTR